MIIYIMSFLETNSTNTPLLADAVFRGKSTLLESQFNTANISIKTDVSGVLNVWHSTTGNNYHTYGDDFVCSGELIKQVILKGKYFYLTYKNNATNQSSLQLLCKLTNIIREGILTSGGGGGAGGDVNITGCDVTLPVSLITGFATETTLGAIDTKLGGELAVNVISGFATEETLSDTYTLLNDNIGTGGLSVSLTALDGEKITNTVVDTKRGLDVNMINSLSVDISGQTVVTDISGQTVDISGQTVVVDVSGQTVNVGNDLNINILDTNSTVYDFTDNSSTMTGADDRFFIDRVRPDSWAFKNDKNQNGSNVFLYSNTVTSPLSAQQFPILHGDLESLYFVAGINRTDDRDALPFMVIYSPSPLAFYTSRWVYLVDASEKLIQGEKVLLFYGIDPIHIYTNLRHIRLLYNAIASQGPQLETEVCYLMSINTASALPASSVYYNLYNAGFILNDVKHTHNDYAFNSGINSKKDLVLSKLNIAGDAISLAVAVSNTVVVSNTILEQMTFTDSNLNVNISNTDVPVSNTALTYMSYKEVASGTYGLEVVNRNVQQSTNYLFDVGDISITDETPTIDVRTFRLMSVFGLSTHSGGGSHDIVVQYSTNGLSNNWYDSPNVISTTSSGKFALDLKDFCVSYIRFRFQVALDTLNMNVCLK